jgi:hypothetical protein
MRARLHIALGTMALGLAVLAVAAIKAAFDPSTTLAVFATAAILVELWNGWDEFGADAVEERPFTLLVPVQIAAIMVLGPWPAALVAGVAVLSVRRVHGSSWPAICLGASLGATATLAAGFAYELTGGHVSAPALPDDLMPVLAMVLVYFGVYAALLTAALPWHGIRTDPVVAAGEVGLGVILGLFAARHAWNLLALAPVALLIEQTESRLSATRREVSAALETFANIVDERDPSTYRHSVRVAGHVAELAAALGLPPADVTRLRWAGRLHDLGKVAVDAAVLRKPGHLDANEWAVVRRAPRLSARLLHRFRFAAMQARAVEYQHERFDGNGYYGIPGEELPLASHFLMVADSFDAMTTDRPFRSRMSEEAALEEIERNGGTQFHPTVAKAFIALRRGQEVEEVLEPAEIAAFRDATISYRLSRPHALRELRERPELTAVGGVGVALLGAGIGSLPLAAFGGACIAIGLALRGLRRFRAARLAAEIRRAVAESSDSIGLFEWVVAAISKPVDVRWAGLVVWHEDGLGGTVAIQQGDVPPAESRLFSWLVREAGADSILTTAGDELGVDGLAVALPLRRGNSALAGFLVFALGRQPPGFVSDAIAASLDELGLALPGQPGPELVAADAPTGMSVPAVG